jgi:hypothetical protein
MRAGLFGRARRRNKKIFVEMFSTHDRNVTRRVVAIVEILRPAVVLSYNFIVWMGCHRELSHMANDGGENNDHATFEDFLY